MSTTTTTSKYRLKANSKIEFIPMNRIRILNPRSRNKKGFDHMVENIDAIGLKRPVTLSKSKENGYYDLVCGQGRYEAFLALGKKEIPANIIEATEEECYLISLVENLARRQHSSYELLSAIRIMEKRGHSHKEIAQKIGFDISYVQGISYLLKQGEERLILAVEKEKISLSLAIRISKLGSKDTQKLIMEAKESGEINASQLRSLTNLVSLRAYLGKTVRTTKKTTGSRKSSSDLQKYFKDEVRRRKELIQKADIAEDRLRFFITTLNHFLSDENFYTLLRAEGLCKLPEFLKDQLQVKRHG